MPTEDVYRVAADAKAWSWNQTLIDGIADRGIGRPCSFRAHVAFGRKAGHEIVSSGQGCKDSSLRNRLLNGLQVFRSGVKEQMNMDIDQTGQKRPVPQVNDLGSLRMSYGRAYLGDSFAFYEDFRRGEHFASLNVEKPRRAQHCGMGRRCWLRLRR
jgi:hypothetical protein